MYVTYFENNFCVLGKEFFRLSYGQLFGVHNPQKASKFSTLEDAQQFLTENVTFERCGVAYLDDVIVDWLSWVNSKTIYRELTQKSSFSRPYDNEDKYEVLDWWFGYHKDIEAVSYEDFQTWPDLYTMFDVLFGIIHYTDDRLSVKIAVKKDTTYEQFKKEFELVKSRLEAPIDIFEHTLSYYCSYFFDWENNRIIDHRDNVYCEGDLEEIFYFWRENLYY